MKTTSVPQPGTFLVTVEDMSQFRNLKKAISMLRGVTSVSLPKSRASLYDPETGEYLNDETMKVIEDARKGKGIAFTGSFEDFQQWAKAL